MRDSGGTVVPYDRSGERVTAAPCVVRPRAAFIAQLIAANENLPQFRVLRREDPLTASAAYQSAVGQNDTRPQTRLTLVTI